MKSISEYKTFKYASEDIDVAETISNDESEAFEVC